MKLLAALFLLLSTAAPAEAAYMRVRANDYLAEVQVRTCPSTSCHSLGFARPGTRAWADAMRYSDGYYWYLVEFDNGAGWVRGDLLQFD